MGRYEIGGVQLSVQLHAFERLNVQFRTWFDGVERTYLPTGDGSEMPQ